tara:strand:- start:161 stop:397 length:237 start_codon:yes stop_codon:yes gene_type:complete
MHVAIFFPLLYVLSIRESQCTLNDRGFVCSALVPSRGKLSLKKRISDAINGAIKGLIMLDIVTNSDVKKIIHFPVEAH